MFFPFGPLQGIRGVRADRRKRREFPYIRNAVNPGREYVDENPDMSRSPSSTLGTPILVAGLLLVLGVVTYAGSFSGDFLNWDDAKYITSNPELRAPFPDAVGRIFSTFYFSNYNPLQRLSYLFEWKFFGDNALPYRIVNLLLHVLAGFLLYRVLDEWLDKPLAAFLGAALFVVHPLNVENVVWISERKTLLATVFAFAATWCYLRGARGEKRQTGLALLLFTLGLASKSSIVVLPGLFVLLDLSMRRKLAPGRYALFALPAALFGVLQVLAASAGSAIRPLHGGTVVTHVMTVVAALGRYASSWLWPVGQAPMHSFPPVMSAGDPRLWLGVAVLAVVAIGAAVSLRRNRVFLVGLVWFPVVLLPTLVIPIPIIYAERYLYLATPFLLAGSVVWLIDLKGSFRVPARVGLATATFGLIVATMLYAADWKNSARLWTRSVGVDPDVAEAWSLLGGARMSARDPAGAVIAFENALSGEPEMMGVESNLALALLATGRRVEAGQVVTIVVERELIAPRAWAILGAVRDLGGDPNGAKAAFAAGLAASPGNAHLLKNLANFHLRRGQPAAATKALEAAVRASPGDGEAWRQLGEVFRIGNQPAAAARCEVMYRKCQ